MSQRVSFASDHPDFLTERRKCLFRILGRDLAQRGQEIVHDFEGHTANDKPGPGELLRQGVSNVVDDPPLVDPRDEILVGPRAGFANFAGQGITIGFGSSEKVDRDPHSQRLAARFIVGCAADDGGGPIAFPAIADRILPERRRQFHGFCDRQRLEWHADRLCASNPRAAQLRDVCAAGRDDLQLVEALPAKFVNKIANAVHCDPVPLNDFERVEHEQERAFAVRCVLAQDLGKTRERILDGLGRGFEHRRRVDTLGANVFDQLVEHLPGAGEL